MNDLTDEEMSNILKRRQEAEEQARITSIDEVIETWESLTPHNLIFASRPSKNYSIRQLFENPGRTEYFVRNETDNNKIKALVNVIYTKFSIVDEWGLSNKSMGTEYIANIVYPLALQGRLQDIPQEYVHDSIGYFEDKVVSEKKDGDRNMVQARNCDPCDHSKIERYRGLAGTNYESSRHSREKADLIRQEYSLLRTGSASGTQS